MKNILLSLGLTLATATAFAATQNQSNEDKPTRFYMFGDKQNKATSGDYSGEITNKDGTVFGQFEFQSSDNYNQAWVSGLGGSGSDCGSYHYTVPDYLTGEPGVLDGSHNESMVWDWTGWGVCTSDSGYSYPISIQIGNEHCDVNDPNNLSAIKSYEWFLDGQFLASFWPPNIVWKSGNDTYTRNADTVWHVQTGGKAVPGLQNLWQFNGSASEVLNKRAVPSNFNTTPMRGIDPTQIQILGKNLDTNGVMYKILPNGQDLDVTPKVPGVDFYTLGVSGQKYCSYFQVFVNQPTPGTTTTYSDTTGHAFYRFYSYAPDEYLKNIHPELLTYENNNWGFYPHGAICGLPGLLANDNTHGQNMCRVFYIGYSDFVAGLTFTKGLKVSPPEYCIAIGGYSCVGAARGAGKSAGISLPSGVLDVFPQNFGADILKQFPGDQEDYTPHYSK